LETSVKENFTVPSVCNYRLFPSGLLKSVGLISDWFFLLFNKRKEWRFYYVLFENIYQQNVVLEPIDIHVELAVNLKSYKQRGCSMAASLYFIWVLMILQEALVYLIFQFLSTLIL
jgi:hypothetical protein